MGIRAEALAKSFKGRTVVNGVGLTLEKGEVVGLLGPNGAGKTTTFYMIVGLEQPDMGRVWVDGVDVTSLPAWRRSRLGLGYLAQEPSVFRKLSVDQNIMAVLELFEQSRERREKRLVELREELNLSHVARQPGMTLSGGERRRVEIARVLAASPAYVLLDEPFTGVDPIAVGDLQGIVAEMKSKGLGVLITDHNVRDTLAIVDRAHIMYEGRILVSGTAREVADDVTARQLYLGDRFTL